MDLRILGAFALCAMPFCGCVEDDPSPMAPLPTGPYVEFQTEVAGLSGLCLNAAADGLYAVSDKGNICELTLEGATGRVLCESSHDFEAVTLDPVTGTLYIAEEAENAIYRLSGGELSRVAAVDVPGGGVANKGLEGICWTGESLYVANQAEPAMILRCSADGEVEETIPIGFVTFISDICWDAATGTLWILDSRQQRIFCCTPAGAVLRTWSVDFVQKAEAMALDRRRGVVWLGCDETGRLYRVALDC